MKIIKNSILGMIVILFMGCASQSPLQKSLSISSSNNIELFRSPILDQTASTLRPLNKEKDILYYQTYGENVSGSDSLVGFFDVAANIKKIESNTIKDVAILSNKINSNITSLFDKAARAADMNLVDTAVVSDYKLNPYLLIQKTEGEQLMLAAVILMDTGENFPNKYLIQLPVKYTINQLSVLTDEQQRVLDSRIKESFVSLLDRIRKESFANLLLEEKIIISSEFLTPRLKFEMDGNLIEIKDDIVWVRIVGGVCGIYSRDLSYRISRE